MGIDRFSLRLAPGRSGEKIPFRVIIDGREYATSCLLLDDLLSFFGRFRELGEEGRRLDLFFSSAEPYSVSVTRRGGALYLRISDNFDGGILEQGIELRALAAAVEQLAAEALERVKMDQTKREGLRHGIEDLRRWSGAPGAS